LVEVEVEWVAEVEGYKTLEIDLEREVEVHIEVHRRSHSGDDTLHSIAVEDPVDLDPLLDPDFRLDIQQRYHKPHPPQLKPCPFSQTFPYTEGT
jgi:hypothetical protein